MRNIISCMLLLIGMFLMQSTEVNASAVASGDQQTVKVENRQTATATVTQEMGVIQVESEKQSLGGFLAHNWGILSLSLISFLEVVTRLTPSVKDNTVLTFLSNVLNVLIPNLKKGGGRL
ncbi:MAG TPA: hypothetical protein VFG54_09325 [Prolixibacteraceae bacterium]|nr:hypothetical protein [Prolixibacteraceae bacterium]